MYNSLVIKPIKNLGQNFLQDTTVANMMIEELSLTDNDFVIEIGPGTGVLTDRLAKLNCTVLAVEYDPRLVAQLTARYSNNKNITVIYDNFLKWLPQNSPNKPYKVLGSIPYYITSPILHALIQTDNMAKKAVFMVQKEVGEKVCAMEPDASYLSVFVQTFYDTTYVKTISNMSFYPVPKVDSSIIKLEKKQGEEKFTREFIKKYEGFLHKGFGSPRKMINKRFDKQLLLDAGIDPSLRPQDLGVGKWLDLYKLYN
ncbi:ribosomal RNA small subunit methyltransferase A [candidate division WWE3 bacterium RIFOXYA2_FULL_46_9]|uniref:Ribosomal RNA small subunit methyltransferase A n=1 Tax=candidate division WWE3 bacterium RIFOXYA2_FULL_46_9 TaxID=1802636 RepID=A0A1F4W0J6_UNCKA|nr:MAG: ribosomal RNA small subunit methyltransferase A [candidate division WWE3 bacterium RIFOXYA2_FULL_46_9]OGC65029.1 MAG: ribosomal RNA small subunit methyltransferase A [candidate division WWE3 bacterium RIFOXYB2_FULL_41_6]